jgi:hypothetical protein
MLLHDFIPAESLSCAAGPLCIYTLTPLTCPELAGESISENLSVSQHQVKKKAYEILR